MKNTNLRKSLLKFEKGYLTQKRAVTHLRSKTNNILISQVETQNSEGITIIYHVPFARKSTQSTETFYTVERIH